MLKVAKTYLTIYAETGLLLALMCLDKACYNL
jgi:hypothetical protein